MQKAAGRKGVGHSTDAPGSARIDSAARAGQLWHVRESLMSHAEYAPKQLPVLTRLVMTLRQIPAVQTALARLKSLFRSGTNPEPIAIDTLAAEPAVDDARDIVDAAPFAAPPAA